MHSFAPPLYSALGQPITAVDEALIVAANSLTPRLIERDAGLRADGASVLLLRRHHNGLRSQDARRVFFATAPPAPCE